MTEETKIEEETKIDNAFKMLIKKATNIHAQACKLVADFVEAYGYEELEERLEEVECEYTVAVIKGYMPKPVGEKANGKKPEKTKAQQIEAYAKTITATCEKKGINIDKLVIALGYEL